MSGMAEAAMAAEIMKPTANPKTPITKPPIKAPATFASEIIDKSSPWVVPLWLGLACEMAKHIIGYHSSA